MVSRAAATSLRSLLDAVPLASMEAAIRVFAAFLGDVLDGTSPFLFCTPLSSGATGDWRGRKREEKKKRQPPVSEAAVGVERDVRTCKPNSVCP